MPKQMSVALLCVLILITSGCGFVLRGNNKTMHATQYNSIQLATDDLPDALPLTKSLIKHLDMYGYMPVQNSQASIHLANVQFRRYELVGKLTEVRLVLLVDVTYRFNEQTYTYPLQVERSYQYNKASVNTTDAQGDKTKLWLYDHLAKQIAEQYQVLSHSHSQHI